MGVQERRARQKENLRQDILEAARELFVRHGIDNVSMRRIAEKIEYSPTTIYLYFKDKKELLFQLCEETFARLNDRLAQIKGTWGTDDPVRCLREGLRCYVYFGIEHPHHYQLTFLTPHEATAEEKELYLDPNSAGMQAYGCLREAVAACADAGLLNVPNVDAATQVFWATAHGITSLLITEKDFIWTDHGKLIDLTIDKLIDGFRREEGPR